ncbi:hypothetical protein PF005_g1430 [Phytophthora fragariae]|uniref:Uncharacterized protein n=1 Tax=Phytophthora fragariae TaxID=53985 RepID=A0A6A3ZHY5_9STRA|nr:hypothetical protein PF003_g24715 [Phytophthora fragariae]KAE8948887.1 hypothetical protein PF009_g1538 [Phytophthora fragariae]KAE9029735.1 hypothetical protein PF011_g923 [Phytophthora fragariae]KAE9138384.1 hypothetical protein PF007_g1447 [Phytophthora fragariae]KAE9154852.1 hypothetical protein PF006_g1150 [Phytophthora fragariae]
MGVPVGSENAPQQSDFTPKKVAAVDLETMTPTGKPPEEKAGEIKSTPPRGI